MEGGAPISVTARVGWDETLLPRTSERGIVALALMPGTGIDGPAWYEFARGLIWLSEPFRNFRGPRSSLVASGEPSREGGS